MAKTAGYAIPGNFTINNSSTYVIVQNANPAVSRQLRSSPSPAVRISRSCGNTVTVGGISGPGIIENTETQTTGFGSSINGTLVVNTAAGSSSSYSGYLRNNAGGTGTLALVKNGAGSLTLTGAYVGQYTGGLTVNAGMLSYAGGTAPNCNYTLTGGTLNIGGNRSMKVLQMTGGSLTGGTITGSSAYDLEAGTVSLALGGSVGFNKSTPGYGDVHQGPTQRALLDFRRRVGDGHVVEDDVGRLADDERRHAERQRHLDRRQRLQLQHSSRHDRHDPRRRQHDRLDQERPGNGDPPGHGQVRRRDHDQRRHAATGQRQHQRHAAGTATITINSGGTLQLGDGGTGGSVSGTVTVNSPAAPST